MFPTFISILDIQSWWEVPSIAHFCSLFRGSFNLLDFDIEDLEEALLTDGTTEESTWLQELIVRLLNGCLPNNEISTFNYQMFMRRLFRQKCQEYDIVNPFNSDIDFQFLPLKTKVQILHALCDFRLDAEDVLDNLKNLEADSLRVEPLGHDSNESVYWYFYGTRLYREDYISKNNKKVKTVWQVICFTEEDWHQQAKKFKESTSKVEKKLYRTLTENFLPDLPRLFQEKEALHRKRLLEWLPRRTSTRLDTKRQKESTEEKPVLTDQESSDKEVDLEKSRKKRKAFEKSKKRKKSDTDEDTSDGSKKRCIEETRYEDEMADRRKRELRTLNRVKAKTKTGSDTDSVVSRSNTPAIGTALGVGRQTNNSLASATGDQIVIQSVSNPNRKKLKTSQVFRQSDEDLQTGMYKILEAVKNHDDAWPFIDPVEEEYAPNYYSIIRKPMDLQRMEDKLDAGEYLTFGKFKGDFQLIVDNCRQYNGSDNEYTEMVDNLQQVFQRATDRYLDQITSSDEDIAVEFQDTSRDSKTQSSTGSTTNTKRKKIDNQTPTTGQKRKSTTNVTQTEKKIERSPVNNKTSRNETKDGKADEKEGGSTEKNDEMDEDKNDVKIGRNGGRNVSRTSSRNVSKNVEPAKSINRNDNKSTNKTIGKNDGKNTTPVKTIGKTDNKNIGKTDNKNIGKADNKNVTRNDIKNDSNKKNKNKPPVKKKIVKGRKAKKASPSPVWRSLSPSWPPTTPEPSSDEDTKTKTKHKHWKEVFKDKKNNKKDDDDDDDDDDEINDSTPPKNTKEVKPVVKNTKEPLKSKDVLKPKVDNTVVPKEKNIKLRETIEKLKAKNDLTSEDKFLRKEKVYDKEKPKKLAKVAKKCEFDFDDDCSDSNLSDDKKSKKVKKSKKIQNIDGLNDATEQTLKDIKKWLDTAPKDHSEFSSASNSPSHFLSDELDMKITEQKKTEKPRKDIFKRNRLKDQTKLIRRREVQRTIDRLQPGKSKGNLLSNIQNTNKPEELFPLGPLAKLRESKNSLVVKPDDTAPKLSLGTVLDSFGKHNFSEEIEKIEETEPKDEPVDDPVKTEDVEVNEEEPMKKEETVEVKTEKNSATPNLSAWFKAFGAPKVQTGQKKKPENETEIKEQEPVVTETKEPEIKPEEPRKVISPEPDSPAPIRQRRGSTGSSMSERSSFSQDMDSSPRMSMDERLGGSYPAPYPSPLHRSPMSASPVMASPRQEETQRPYPPLNGSIRVGFYQDTVSTKSSPDKSDKSPYQYPEHVYTPPSTIQQSGNYPYTPNPYYTTYATTTNPPSYYDTTKPLTDQYNAKTPTDDNPSPEPSYEKPPPTPTPIIDTTEYRRPPEKFPVKKRLYNETETDNDNIEISLITGRQLNISNQTENEIGYPDVQPNQNIRFNQDVYTDYMMSNRSEMMSNRSEMMSNRQEMISNRPEIMTGRQDVIGSRQDVIGSRQDVIGSRQDVIGSRQDVLGSRQDVIGSRQDVIGSRQDVIGSRQEMNNRQELSNRQDIMSNRQEMSNRQDILGNRQDILSNRQDILSNRQDILSSRPDLNNRQDMSNRQDILSSRQDMSNRQDILSNRQDLSGRQDILGNRQDISNQQDILSSRQDLSNRQDILSGRQDLSNRQDILSSRQDLSNRQDILSGRQDLSNRQDILSGRQDLSNRQDILSGRQDLSNRQDILSGRQDILGNRQESPSTISNQFNIDLTRTTQYPNYPKVSTTVSNPQTQNELLRYDSRVMSHTISYPTRSDSQTISQPQPTRVELPGNMSVPQPTRVDLTGGMTVPQPTRVELPGNYKSEMSVSQASRVELPGNMSVPQPSRVDLSQSSRVDLSGSMTIPQPTRVDLPGSMSVSQSSRVELPGSYKSSEMTIPQPPFNPSTTLRSNLAHMVDRFSTDERLLQSIPNSSYQSLMFSKPPTTTGIFSGYNREQNPSNIQPMMPQPMMPQKDKTRKKTKTKTEGFQTYAGLKNESSAISLKTASVVPGSAFNFGPTATGLGLPTWGVGTDNPNFLEEYRTPTNYFLPRSTPENTTDKNVRQAHQQTTAPTPSFPFLGHPQPRTPGYPSLPSPFMNPHQASPLMDSPLYQQYLHSGVLHQGLLNPSAPYPAGYHPALGMRQPYDSMTPPSWL